MLYKYETRDMDETQIEPKNQIPEAQGVKPKQKKTGRKPPPPGLKDDLTVIAHICIVLYSVLVCYLCFVRPFEFFTWHPLLLSLGWMLLMTEGVLIISKENPVVRKLRLNHTWKLRYHWIILSVALLLSYIGFLVVVINKNRLNKEHFKSWHALFGLISLVACIPAVVNGIATLFDVELKRFIKPSIIKLIHQTSGSIAFLFGGLSVVLSVYTKWFAKSSNNNKYLFLLGLITTLYSVMWTLQRPLLKCFRKLFKL